LRRYSAARVSMSRGRRLRRPWLVRAAILPQGLPAVVRRVRVHGRRCWSVLSLFGSGLLLGGVLSPGPAVAQSGPTNNGEARDTLPLRPGDLIRLRVWREPELSGVFPVNEAGVAVLPKLGPLDVASAAAEAVGARIARQLRGSLNHSSVDVTVLRRVQVVGAVQKPGLYHVDPTMTIGDALALAGGVTPNGRSDELEIIHQGQKLPGRVSGRTLISHSPIRSGDQIYVPERSWLSRNTGTVLAGISTLTALLYFFTR
jgi:protein involved in polysaccharide export with SLBB domain